jgi:hypothetical protein
MLKPLFGKTLKIQTTYGTSQAVGYGNRAKPSAADRGYVLDDQDDLEMMQYNSSGNTQFHSTVVKGGGSDDGSETFILPDVPQDAVVKRTEISIVNTERPLENGR